MIDTPGFNDTSRSDADLLKEIAFILGALRKAEVNVAGIIYLHRISEPRITGSALRSIRLFEALCGSQCFPYVVLVSTMWESLEEEDRAIAVDRETTLKGKDEFWGRMVHDGAQVMRHGGDASSAREILSCATFTNRSVVMDIQRELIDEGKELDETSAGRYLLGELYDVRKRQKQEIAELEGIMEEALQDHDEATISAISAQRQEYEGLIQRTYTQTDDLEVTFENLAGERADRYASLFQEGDQYEKEFEEYRKQIQDLEDALDRMKKNRDRERNRFTLDKWRLQQQADQYANEKRKMELQLKEKRAASRSTETTLHGYQQTESTWQKILRRALPKDLQKVASSNRSSSFPRSQVSTRQGQNISFPQPQQVSMAKDRPKSYHEVVPTKAKDTDSSSNEMPRLVQRSSSFQPYSRDYREIDHASKKRSETIVEDRRQASRNPRTTIVDPPVSETQLDEPLTYRTIVVSPGYADEVRMSGPTRRIDEPPVLRRSYN